MPNPRKTLAALGLALAAALCGASAAPDAAAPARPRITGLSHVAFSVRDLDRTLAFYEGYLGFAEPYMLRSDAGAVQAAWIKINDRQTLELFPTGGAAPRDGDSLSHIALETDDAQGMLDYLRSRGVKGPGGRPLPERAKAGRIGNLNYFAEDPDGHGVEFMQYMPGGWTQGNAGKDLPPTRIAWRMGHAGITVANLGASLAFYRDILGFRETWRGSSDGRTLSWVNLRVPDGRDYIELMLVGARPDAGRLHVLHHVCLDVPDARAAADALAARTLPAGCRAPDPLKVGVNGRRQLNCYDPDGTRVEIMEVNTVDGRPVPPSGAPAPGG